MCCCYILHSWQSLYLTSGIFPFPFQNGAILKPSEGGSTYECSGEMEGEAPPEYAGGDIQGM